ncbi:MAG: hypothetical protein IJZ53_07900 [Tyzzerella sp.]|nr:hypothetical protein [Tyzzerella sp.]
MKSEKRESNILKYRKPRHMNIGIVVFGIIFIYLIATIIMYITAPHVTAYEVRQGSILKDNAYTALALRSEVIVYADAAGYINYYVEDNSKVRVGTDVYTLSSQELNFDQVATDTEATLTKDEEKALMTKIQSFNENFHEADYTSVYQFKNELQGSLDEYTSHSKLSQLNQLLTSGNYSGVTLKSAADDGIIVFSMDGMEAITPETVTIGQLSKGNYKKTEFLNNTSISSGDPIYKLVTDDKWSLMFEISEETAETLVGKSTVKINFKKDNQELRANLELQEKNGKHIAILYFHNSMIRYINDRYLDIELVLEDETGLKIPKSAETSKDFYIVPKSYLTQGGNSSDEGVLLQGKNEDGNTITQFFSVTVYYEEEDMIYLDPNVFEEGAVLLKPDSAEEYPLKEIRSLKGVYCINKGYAVFKQIEILCESDDYYIIEEGNDFGLSNYDHIALDAETINENDVVF